MVIWRSIFSMIWSMWPYLHLCIKKTTNQGDPQNQHQILQAKRWKTSFNKNQLDSNYSLEARGRIFSSKCIIVVLENILFPSSEEYSLRGECVTDAQLENILFLIKYLRYREYSRISLSENFLFSEKWWCKLWRIFSFEYKTTDIW